MAKALNADIKATGINQGDLVKFLENVRDAVNEVNTDADAVFADLTAIRAAIVAITAKLDADAGVTGTDYASTCDPAALTATAIAADALTLNKG